MISIYSSNFKRARIQLCSAETWLVDCLSGAAGVGINNKGGIISIFKFARPLQWMVCFFQFIELILVIIVIIIIVILIIIIILSVVVIIIIIVIIITIALANIYQRMEIQLHNRYAQNFMCLAAPQQIFQSFNFKMFLSISKKQVS